MIYYVIITEQKLSLMQKQCVKDYVQPLFNSLQNDCYHFLYDFIGVLHYCGGILF